MTYQVIPKNQLPKKQNDKPLADITTYKRYGIAKQKTRPQARLTIKERQCNDMAFLKYSESLQDFLLSNYWFWRAKIEDPAISNKGKIPYRKMCKVYESYFGIEWLKRTGYCTQTKSVMSQGHAHKFCYVPGRVQ